MFRRTLLSLATSCLLVFSFLSPTSSNAQAAAAPEKDIAGTWQGTLHASTRDLRIVIKIERAETALKSRFYSLDQGGTPIAVDTTTFTDGNLTLEVDRILGTYKGKLNAEGTTISGTWLQGNPTPLPLVFQRATPQTEWTIPEAPKLAPPMAADADPSFDVATIKPSDPNSQGISFQIQGRKLVTRNTSLVYILTNVYDVQAKQIIGGPDWITNDRFDIHGQPDIDGIPNMPQMKSMYKKLLASRFQLKLHEEKRELPAYVLQLTKTGSKMKKSEGAQYAIPGFSFAGPGILNVRNATMKEFATLMQSMVLDRPVVDKTGLEGRWNFILKWTRNELQATDAGASKTSDASDTPPPLFTALQEQLGLKIDAVKTEVTVLVIDKVEKPSDN